MAQALPEPLSAPTSKLLEMFYSRGGAQAPQPGSTADPGLPPISECAASTDNFTV